VRVVVALALDAGTHVAWDSFTHIGRWGPAHVDWLADTHAGLPGYRWAQYAGGVVGTAAIAFWLIRWWRATPHAPAADRRPPAPQHTTVSGRSRADPDKIRWRRVTADSCRFEM
jgi:hypothetical protein